MVRGKVVSVAQAIQVCRLWPFKGEVVLQLIMSWMQADRLLNAATQMRCAFCRYIHTNGRGLDFHEETKLNMDTEEEKALAERRHSSAAASSSGGSSRGHHFICEAFFLTAKTLHLGAVKAMQVSDQEAEVGAYMLRKPG